MRLPDADPAKSPELDAAFAAFRSTRGIVSNVMKSFAHAPAGLAAIAELGRYCRYHTALAEVQKELVILITGRSVPYAWAHHGPLGLRAGLTQTQLDAIRDGRTPAGLSATDEAIADYVFAYTTLRGVPEPVFARLAAALSPRQITDVNIIAGYFLMVAASIIGMQVDLDPPQAMQAAVGFHLSAEARTRA
jgi:4-carboxymuconolactone decarboxylase